MISRDESFKYQHTDRWDGSKVGSIVTVQPMQPGYLAWRLGLSLDEANTLQAQRQLRQRERLPNFVGEYVINGLGYGGRELQEIHIGALVAHSKALGLDEQIYGGYRCMNFLRDGALFGPHSDKGAEGIKADNSFCAIRVDNWRYRVGFANKNPFNHMTRGEIPGQSAPILASFALHMLTTAAEWEEAVTFDTFYWTPTKDSSGRSLQIEDTVQVVYHRGIV